MRFISFSILFAVFAILFHGVASADAPAPNVIALERYKSFHEEKAADMLKKSLQFRMQARFAFNKGDMDKYRELADVHKHVVLGHLFKHNDLEFHISSISKHQKKQKEARKRAKEAKTQKEKAEWNDIRTKHIACSAWHELESKFQAAGRIPSN